MKIIDNFLNEEEFDFILGTVSSEDSFPWYVTEQNFDKNNADKNTSMNLQFFHMLYYHNSGGWMSDHASILNPIIKRLNPFCLLKSKVNLLVNYNTHTKGNFHTDLDKESISQTGILYLDTTNGPTEFADGSICHSIRNRFVEFATSTKHRSIRQVDKPQRRVININWIPYD
jgi:hypothetical protein|tara:strand:+ start:257 stop:772 length:516 start_codon:yes stop_codon:yes gene_type:complete